LLLEEGLTEPRRANKKATENCKRFSRISGPAQRRSLGRNWRNWRFTAFRPISTPREKT